MSDLERDRKDWTVFTRLSRLALAGLNLGAAASTELERLRQSHPDWEASPGERSDFAVWSESYLGDRGDTRELHGVPTADLLTTMRSLVGANRFANDGLWRRFIVAEPLRSFEALRDNALQGDWQSDEWEQLFYFLRENDDRPLQMAVTAFLLQADLAPLAGAGHSIGMWFEGRFLRLVDFYDGPNEPLKLWDKLAKLVVDESGKLPEDIRDDPTFAVLNEPPGQLAEILVHELNRRKVGEGSDLPLDLRKRFDIAIRWGGDAGLTAQCAFCMQLPFLDYVASGWVARRLVPLLLPNSPNALMRWKARFRAHKLGSANLFNETKKGLLWTFDHADEESLSDGQVLLLLQAAYSKSAGAPIELSSSEAKDALGRAGPRAMSSAARILRQKADTDAGANHWTKVVKPVLMFVWPADDALQTEDTTARLVDLALQADEAFPDAVSTLRPFLVAAWKSDQNWHYETDFNETGMAKLSKFPDAGLSLLDSLIPADTGPARLNELLDRIETAKPAIKTDDRFLRLRGLAKRLAA